MKTNIVPGDILYRDDASYFVIGNDGTSFFYVCVNDGVPKRTFSDFDCEANKDRLDSLGVVVVSALYER